MSGGVNHSSWFAVLVLKSRLIPTPFLRQPGACSMCALLLHVTVGCSSGVIVVSLMAGLLSDQSKTSAPCLDTVLAPSVLLFARMERIAARYAIFLVRPVPVIFEKHFVSLRVAPVIAHVAHKNSPRCRYARPT